MKKKNLIIIIILFGIIITGSIFMVKAGKISFKKLKLIEVKNINTDSIVEANNQFAFDYYLKIKDKESDNIFFSPFSISSAIAMTYEGAKGQTSQEIQNVFHFPKDITTIRKQYAQIFNNLNKKNKKYQLNIANALWAQKDYKFSKEYFDLIERYYSGNVTNLDFITKPEKSRTTINNWVEDKTNNKIKNLIPSGSINDSTRLILTNAIYFKGNWLDQFDKDLTTDENFYIEKNNTIITKMMQRTDGKFNYYENNDIQILEIPYSEKELSMIIILPKNKDLKSLEKSISTENLQEWKSNLVEQKVDIFIPRFKFETKYLIADDLKQMGMPISFTDNADFSGMTGKKDLKISEVIHQAFVEVNEEGTEAAAATAVVIMEFTSIEQPAHKLPIFRADHPFIFLIQENSTENILFMGRVVNPNL